MNTPKTRHIAEYQWQFPGGPKKKPRVVSLADMTREELQEALAISMDHMEIVQRKLAEADESIELWAEGRDVEEDEEE